MKLTEGQKLLNYQTNSNVQNKSIAVLTQLNDFTQTVDKLQKSENWFKDRYYPFHYLLGLIERAARWGQRMDRKLNTKEYRQNSCLLQNNYL